MTCSSIRIEVCGEQWCLIFLQIAFINVDVGKGWTNVFFLVDLVFVGFYLWLFCAATGSGSLNKTVPHLIPDSMHKQLPSIRMFCFQKNCVAPSFNRFCFGGRLGMFVFTVGSCMSD